MAAAELAESLGLECHAGHGLDYETVAPVAAIPQMRELNIGHFLMGESLFVGFDAAIGRMRDLMEQGTQPVILGVGTDIVDERQIRRSIDRFGDKFLNGIFTDAERKLGTQRGQQTLYLAKRFAAKEAVYKALTGADAWPAWAGGMRK